MGAVAKPQANRLRGGFGRDSLVWLVCAALGVGFMRHSLVVLPQRYDALSRDGVPAVAMTYDGQSRSWKYSKPRRQFDRLAYGEPVPMLVDRRDPQIAYTVDDVRNRSNAGFGGGTWLGLLFVLGGVGAALFQAALLVRLRARIDAAVEQEPPLNLDHLSLFERERLTRTLCRIDGAARLVLDARELPLTRPLAVRVDRRAFVTAMEEIRNEMRAPALERSLPRIDLLIATAHDGDRRRESRRRATGEVP